MIKKNLTRGLQFTCALGIAAAAVATTFTTTNVVASASAPSGTCALIASQSAMGQGNSLGDATSTILGTVTFNGPYAIDLQNTSSNGSTATTNLSTASGNTTVTGSVRGSGAYTVRFVGTETNPDSTTQTMDAYFSFLPSNNNLTYLVSTQKNNQNGGAFTGVCQVQ